MVISPINGKLPGSIMTSCGVPCSESRDVMTELFERTIMEARDSISDAMVFIAERLPNVYDGWKSWKVGTADKVEAKDSSYKVTKTCLLRAACSFR